MFRRLAANLPALAASCGRFYTPSEDMKKLYASDFDKAQFPCNIVPSDSVLFAKFLYQAGEVKNAHDAISKDFQTISAAIPNLPVFWERTAKVDDIKQFKGLSEPTTFTLQWMQANGMLDQLADVAEVYETYVNAKMKRVVAKIYVGPGKTEDKATIDKAKKVADSIAKEHKEFSSFKVGYKILVDRTIVSGFAVDVQGVFVNEAEGRKTSARTADETDYTTIPPPHVPKTHWEDNVETEVLRKYVDSLSTFDAEEIKYGV